MNTHLLITADYNQSYSNQMQLGLGTYDGVGAPYDPECPTNAQDKYCLMSSGPKTVVLVYRDPECPADA